MIGEGEMHNAQGILDASAITLPTGDLINGAYDESGNLYQMPDYIVSDPENIVLDPQEDTKEGKTATESSGKDEDDAEKKREEKGKTVLKTGEVVKVKARLSDRGGPDVFVTVGKDQAVRVLVRRIQEEANVPFYHLA